MFAKLEGLEKKYMELEQSLADPDIFNDQERYRKLTKAHADLRDVVELYRRHKKEHGHEQGQRQGARQLPAGDFLLRAASHGLYGAVERPGAVDQRFQQHGETAHERLLEPGAARQ